MTGFVKIFQTLCLLIVRVGVGAIMVLHGWNRWQGQGQGPQRQIDYLTQFGTPYPAVAGWGAIIFELVGGVFLIAGALTPLIGLGILLQQVLTIAYTNWYRHANLLNPDGSYAGGYEYNVALGLLGLLLMGFGAGSVSVDRLIRRKPNRADTDNPAAASEIRRQPVGV